MGAESGQNNTDMSALENVLVVSTEMLETISGKITDAAASVRRAYQPIPTARAGLTVYNLGGCITRELQDLYDVESRYYKHIGQLETAAGMLRNIAITYDNAEQTLIGGSERPLVPVPAPPGIDPFDPSGKPVDPEPGKKSSSGGWKREKRQFEDENGETEWYNELFNTKGQFHIGQFKKTNYPESGGYTNQTTQSRGFGIDFFKRSIYDEDPTKTKNPNTGIKEGPWYHETKPKGSEPFAPKKIGTICEIYADYSASWTGIGAQTYKNTDNLKYKAEAYVARAEFNARAGVGAYLYKTPDGQIVNAYGLSAQVGGSFTVAGAAANIDAGSVYAGGIAGASLVVGQVYANANCTVGLVGGKFMAVVSGAVGADAFKATATVGARLVGVEVKASASVKIGVSAKFEVGFDGGEFKANIGAALGLGVEINVSIDFSKVASVVKDIASKIGDTVVDAARTVGDAIGGAARSAWRFIRRRW